MNEITRQQALEKVAVGSAAIGGVSGAALGTALGAALRYSSEPGEEHSVLTNPIMLGALGAGLGSLGGAAVDAVPTNKQQGSPSFDDTLEEGLRATVGRPIKSMLSQSYSIGPTVGSVLGSAGGLYGIGAYAGNETSNEIIRKVERKLSNPATRNITLRNLKNRNPRLYNKYIKALVAQGRLHEIINTELEAGAKSLGLLGSDKSSKTLALLRRMRYWNPVRALSLGLLEGGKMAIRPDSWLRAPRAKINAFKTLPTRKAKIKAGLKGAGKGAGVAATLIALGMLGKQVFGKD